jgi:hypothetical protein
MHDITNKKFGVTTVIDYGKRNGEADLEGQMQKGDGGSEASGSVAGLDDWNSSQSNLAEKANEESRNGATSSNNTHHHNNMHHNNNNNNNGAWNITVKKSIVQTRN